MALEQLNRSIDFVSDSPPSNANDGELFLDTSLAPPEIKVFDASIGSFVRPQTAQNLDQKVSNAGDKNSQSEITSAVNAAGTGIDWSTKTPRFDSGSGFSSGTGAVISVSGSGYITFIRSNSLDDAILSIDGTTNTPISGENNIIKESNVSLLFRFDSSFELRDDDSNNSVNFGVAYVLD
jgi:hypothetical protein